MTITIAARDRVTGALGMAISSSSPAVASRCLHVRAGVGIAASQNVTNPALGQRVLDFMALGDSPADAVGRAASEDPFGDYRQLMAVDTAGEVFAYSGRRTLGTFSSASGHQCVAAGNMLAVQRVPEAMVEAFESSDATSFEGRLLDGLRGGAAAGGEEGPLRSTGLLVIDEVSWPVSDLRVDDHADPIGELARLLDLWLPVKCDYIVRALDPASAPSYGVPGDR
jgi:uncharacterized Ntn-hydrolase superfamily protein